MTYCEKSAKFPNGNALIVCTGAEISVWEAGSIDDVNYTISKYAYLIDYIGILTFCA